ncbi:MAG: hypothetical protein ACLVFP_08960 [Bifidobacterium longum]
MTATVDADMSPRWTVEHDSDRCFCDTHRGLDAADPRVPVHGGNANVIAAIAAELLPELAERSAGRYRTHR